MDYDSQEHEDCDRQLCEAEDKIIELQATLQSRNEIFNREHDKVVGSSEHIEILKLDLEAKDKQIEQLKAALKVILPPKLGEGWVPTTRGAMDKYHEEAMLEYLNTPERVKARGYEVVSGTFYSLAWEIAERALGAKNKQKI